MGPRNRSRARHATSGHTANSGTEDASKAIQTSEHSSNIPLLTAVIAVLAIALNLNTLGHGFVYDDARGIVSNGDVIQTNPIQELFLNDFWGKPMSRFQSHKSYRPFTVLTFRLSHHLAGGLRSWDFHVANVLIHAVTCCLYFHACCRVFGSSGPAFVAALLFTVHPIHCEAVANVVGRAELLGGAWFLVAFLLYAAAIRPGGETCSSFTMFGAMICAGIAMLSKEQGITVLAVVLVYDFSVVGRLYPVDAISAILGRFPLFERYGSGLLRRIMIVSVTATLLIVLRVWMMGGGQPIFNENELPALECPSTMTAGLTFAYYAVVNAAILIFPNTLCSDWSYRTIPLVTDPTEPRGMAVAIAVVIFFATAGAMLIRPRTAPSPTTLSTTDSNVPQPFPMHVGVALMLLTFLPSSNVFFRVGFVVAERVLYLPSMGACIIAAAFFVRLSKQRVLRTIVTVAVVVAFATKTVTRNADWRSDFDLHKAGVRDNPGNVKLQTNFGMLLHERAQDTETYTELERKEYLQQAEAVYRHTLNHVIGEDRFPNLYFSYGNLLQGTGRVDEAISMYHRGLEKKDKTRTTLNILTNLGSLLYKQKKYDEAEKYFDTCLSIDDNHLSAHNGLAALYAATHRVEQAEAKFALIVQRSPSAEAHFNYGTLLATQGGRYAAAEEMFLTALRLNPAHSGAKSNLDYVRFHMKQGKGN